MNIFESKINEAWENYRNEKANELYPNVMFLGVSGAGKSSLMNRIFGVEVAKVSNVKPETQGFDHIYMGKKYGMNVNIIDTAGYELHQADSYYDMVHDTIINGVKGNAVHIVWYCIPVVNERIEDMDITILSKLLSEEKIRKRLCVVFTKCDEDDEDGSTAQAYRRVLKEKCPPVETFETSNLPDLPLDLFKLIEWSAKSIDDEDLKNNFIASQFVDLARKKESAKNIIKASSAAAAAAGAIPIPFADSVVLVPIQVKMIGSIIDIYGVSSLAMISKTVVSDVIISQLGRSAAKALVSVIPFAGTLFNIATSAINATVASSITAAIGYAISEICYINVKKYLNGEEVIWDKIFDENVIMSYVKKFSSNQGK